MNMLRLVFTDNEELSEQFMDAQVGGTVSFKVHSAMVVDKDSEGVDLEISEVGSVIAKDAEEESPAVSVVKDGEEEEEEDAIGTI